MCDRWGQAFETIHVGAVDRRHVALQEGRIGLIDHPLGFCGDRVEDQRRLTRPGHSSEHRQPAFGYIDINPAQIVHPCTAHSDEVTTSRIIHAARLTNHVCHYATEKTIGGASTSRTSSGQ